MCPICFFDIGDGERSGGVHHAIARAARGQQTASMASDHVTTKEGVEKLLKPGNAAFGEVAS